MIGIRFVFLHVPKPGDAGMTPSWGSTWRIIISIHVADNPFPPLTVYKCLRYMSVIRKHSNEFCFLGLSPGPCKSRDHTVCFSHLASISGCFLFPLFVPLGFYSMPVYKDAILSLYSYDESLLQLPIGAGSCFSFCFYPVAQGTHLLPSNSIFQVIDSKNPFDLGNLGHVVGLKLFPHEEVIVKGMFPGVFVENFIIFVKEIFRGRIPTQPCMRGM